MYQPTGNLNAFYLQPLVGGLDAVRGVYSRVKRAQLSNPSLAGGGMQPSLSIGASTLTGFGSDHEPNMIMDSCMLYITLLFQLVCTSKTRVFPCLLTLMQC